MYVTRYLLIVVAALSFVYINVANAEDAAPKAKTPDALTILKNMDKTISGFDDQTMKTKMTVVDVDGSRKSYEFDTLQYGEETRLLKFNSGELKGMRVLIKDRNNMYVYLPGYKRVRRVAAHGMNQSFAGSDMSQKDMSVSAYANVYNPELIKEDDNFYYLKLTPKPGESVNYSYLNMNVDKKDWRQIRIEYYDNDGKMVKHMDNSEVTKFPSGFERHRMIQITDARTGHKTIIEVLDFDANQGLKKSQFTVRNLQWGR